MGASQRRLFAPVRDIPFDRKLNRTRPRGAICDPRRRIDFAPIRARPSGRLEPRTGRNAARISSYRRYSTHIRKPLENGGSTIGETMSKWKALVAAGGFTFFLSTQANAQDDPLTVIYLGAKDCRSCQVFDRYQKETFKQKVAAKGMNFREFKVDSLRYIRQTSAWPADLKWLLDILVSESGAPWFFTVQGQSLVSETQYFSTIIAGE
jgi:hypothetical protein